MTNEWFNSSVRYDDGYLHVTLADGRSVSTPLWWYPRLAAASEEEWNAIELMPMGIHWPELDEDLSVAGMLRGEKVPGAKPPAKGRLRKVEDQ